MTHGFLVGWGVGAVLGVAALVVSCRSSRLTRSAIVLVGTTLVVAVVLGAKTLYLAEAWRAWLGRPEELWALLVSPRMRIPGGILLAIAACWPLSAALGVRPLWLADLTVPIAAGLCLCAVRLGCFLEGCCHGAVTTFPIALTFPPESGAYLWQSGMGLLPEGAGATLPVYPLQLYYALLGVGLAAWAAWYTPRRRYVGESILWFALVYFMGSWLLDLLSAVPSPVTRALCQAGAGGAAIAILRCELGETVRSVQARG